MAASKSTPRETSFAFFNASSRKKQTDSLKACPEDKVFLLKGLLYQITVLYGRS